MYFAEIKNNKVERVIVADSLQWCIDNLGGEWRETKMNDATKNYAGIGHEYDIAKDNFKTPKLSASWTYDKNDRIVRPKILDIYAEKAQLEAERLTLEEI